ncbi:MAG: response regulator, partial [Vibrio sp.]
PVSYDRLTETLNRYLKRHSVLTAFDHLDQRRIDELFNLQSRDSPNQQLPKGIEQVTLDKVKQVFTHQPTQAFTADSLGQMIGISKTTARRYLEYCCASGLIRAENEYGKVGRPERIYLKA